MSISATTLTQTTNQDSALEKIEYKTQEEHASLSKDDFMKLFVTQLQYQDPMNPMESADMATQVAQFNMVDLMYKNNSALENMVNAQNMASSVSAISLLGHRVEYPGSKLFITDRGVEPFTITNNQKVQATDVGIAIYDQKGSLVTKMDLGAMDPGQEIKLDWDGKNLDGEEMPEGAYRVVIRAEDNYGQELELDTKTMGIVSEIENGADGLPKITIKGDTAIDYNDITRIES